MTSFNVTSDQMHILTQFKYPTSHILFILSRYHIVLHYRQVWQMFQIPTNVSAFPKKILAPKILRRGVSVPNNKLHTVRG